MDHRQVSWRNIYIYLFILLFIFIFTVKFSFNLNIFIFVILIFYLFKIQYIICIHFFAIYVLSEKMFFDVCRGVWFLAIDGCLVVLFTGLPCCLSVPGDVLTLCFLKNMFFSQVTWVRLSTVALLVC